uniref:Uncharacterized protein MANES_14G113300 n=1 Tax=Rhizophora mucronata TaxID=61149 RepID=A0A2P2IXX1_RHIMU
MLLRRRRGIVLKPCFIENKKFSMSRWYLISRKRPQGFKPHIHTQEKLVIEVNPSHRFNI